MPPPADIVNPAEPDSPPAAAEAVAPSTENCHPAISVGILYKTSPSAVTKTSFSPKSHPSVGSCDRAKLKNIATTNKKYILLTIAIRNSPIIN